MTKQNKISMGILACAIMLMCCFHVRAQSSPGNQDAKAKQAAYDKEAALKASGPLSQKQLAAGMAADQSKGTTSDVKPTTSATANGLKSNTTSTEKAIPSDPSAAARANGTTTARSASGQEVISNGENQELQHLQTSLAVTKAKFEEMQTKKKMTPEEIANFNGRIASIESRINAIKNTK